MTRDGIKIAISLQHINLSSNGDRGDEAVGQRSNSLAGAPTLPEHRCRSFVVAESVNWNELASGKQRAKSCGVGLVAATCEYLHHDDLGSVQRAV